MNSKSPFLLIGVGTAGSSIARGVNRASGDALRYVLADTDASSGDAETPFILLGGDRLSGHGSGGDIAQARLAAEDSLSALDDHLAGVRLAVVVTALGGGTGAGAGVAICRRLRDRGVPSLVFATIPFAFEGEERQRNAAGVTTTLADEASAAIFLPLDRLVAGEDNMAAALRRAVDTLASGISLFWRLVAKPGYIRLDVERIRHVVAQAGNGRFAVATASGPDRAARVVEELSGSPLLAAGPGPVRSIMCGILAGDDLRLSEVGAVADGLRSAFGERCSFDLATVNDEEAFSGRLSVVALLFETGADDAPSAEQADAPRSRRGRRARNPLAQGPLGRGRFNNVEPTVWRGEDLDTPTYVRRNVTLDV